MLTIKDKIILAPIHFVSLFPLWIQYRVSDFVFVVVYYVMGYRKKVVFQNLKNSFPEKSVKEIRLIAHKFYRHLCDVFFESIYLISITDKNAMRRYQAKNPELVQNLLDERKNIIVATNHYANWEWGCIFSLFFPELTAMPIYKPLHNKLFDRLFLHSRSRFGATPIPMKKTLREIINAQRENKLIGIYSLGDQRPPKQDLHYWTTFLNQETPMITGIEKLAKKFNLAVVFMDIDKIKRGKYITTFRMISENPADEPEYSITEKYARMLETMIIRRPELWLWSHKRWKYKKEDFIPGEKNI